MVLFIVLLLAAMVFVVFMLLFWSGLLSSSTSSAERSMESLYACNTIDDCRYGGCGNYVCANKEAFKSDDSDFKSRLSACVDALPPYERGMKCACISGECMWSDPENRTPIQYKKVGECEQITDCEYLLDRCSGRKGTLSCPRPWVDTGNGSREHLLGLCEVKCEDLDLAQTIYDSPHRPR